MRWYERCCTVVIFPKPRYERRLWWIFFENPHGIALSIYSSYTLNHLITLFWNVSGYSQAVFSAVEWFASCERLFRQLHRQLHIFWGGNWRHHIATSLCLPIHDHTTLTSVPCIWSVQGRSTLWRTVPAEMGPSHLPIHITPSTNADQSWELRSSRIN